jgi:hypothetical protein
MENKYYTPEIEEFHVGFEYEIIHNSEWIKTKVYEHTIGGDFVFEIKNAGHWDVENKPRVKYLDKADIADELGVRWQDISSDQEHWTFKNNMWLLKYSYKNRFMSVFLNSEMLFRAKIKNKTKFKIEFNLFNNGI